MGNGYFDVNTTVPGATSNEPQSKHVPVIKQFDDSVLIENAERPRYDDMTKNPVFAGAYLHCDGKDNSCDKAAVVMLSYYAPNYAGLRIKYLCATCAIVDSTQRFFA